MQKPITITDKLKDLRSISDTSVSLSVLKAPALNKLAFSTILCSAGILGRIALQGIPSVEPLIAVSVIAGYFFGWKYGAYAGALGFFASNFFVWGFQGPWTVAQVIGAGAAGMSSSAIGRVTKSKYGAYLSLGLGVLLFETAVNLGTAWFWIFGPLALVTAMPFGIVHAISTLSFGAIILKTMWNWSLMLKPETPIRLIF